MLVLQLFVNGLAAGAIFALVAVGFALIFNSTRMMHLAHGAVYTFGAYAFYIGVTWIGLDYLTAGLAAVLLSAALGVAIERSIYRAVKRFGGGENSILIASLGLLILLQSLYAIAFSTDTVTVRRGPLPSYDLGGVVVTALHLAVLALVVVVFPLLHAFLRFTNPGRSIRAIADDPSLATAHGLNVSALQTIVFAIGSALAGLAGVLVSVELGTHPEMGFMAVFVATVAVIIGGVGQIYGALLGAFALGLLQQLSVWKIDSAWQHAVVYVVLVIFLFIRPMGALGHRAKVRQA
jgi:branched-chain amino acid transport system permease protein